MKSTIAKRILSLFLVLVLALGLAGCGLVDSVVGLFKGSSGEDEDAVTDAVYATAGGSIQLPEGLAAPEQSGAMNTQFTEGQLAGAFNLTNYNSTAYFSTTGTLTLSIQGTLETGGVDTKWTDAFVSLWQQGNGNTTFIGAVHFKADGTTQTYTWYGLPAGSQYKMTITYNDVPRYKLSGTFALTGVTAEGEADLETDEG